VDYKKIITIPTWKRPDYTRQVLEGFSRCYGIEGYTIYVFAEPGYPDVINVIKSFTNLNIVLSINEKRLGLPGNTRQCLDYGFSQSDYVIHFEDDIVPDKDCLEYFEWARDEYMDDKEIYTVTAFNKCDPVSNDRNIYHEIRRRPWFHSWGWATWTDRWNEIKDNWKVVEENTWSFSIKDSRKDRCEIYPCISRVQNIGELMGTNTLPKDHWIHYNEFWIGSVELEKSKYYEIDKNNKG
jgi:hypothetical protein